MQQTPEQQTASQQKQRGLKAIDILIEDSKYYVLYDGDCAFCNRWVTFIIRNDRKDRFLFVSLQSDLGQSFLKERNLERKNFNTLYLWKPMEFYLTKSAAISKIAKIIGGKYAILAYLNIFPTFFADSIYDTVSKNRLKLSGSQCMLPTAEQRKKIVG